MVGESAPLSKGHRDENYTGLQIGTARSGCVYGFARTRVYLGLWAENW